jgi:gamma-glutamylcysteine synthetase
MGRDEIVSMFDNMRRDKVDAYAATRNTDADELKEIHERAGDTHLTRKTGKEIVELSGAAGDKTRQAMLAGATTNMTYAIAKELGVSGHKGRVPDVSELLGDPEKTKKLLDSVQDKDSTGAQILKQIKDLQSSGKSMNVAQFAGKMAHDGIVETGVEVSSKKVSTVVGSEDTKLAQDTLEAQINALQVLKTSAQHTKDNTDATKNLTKAYKQKVTEESSIFSLFKLGS